MQKICIINKNRNEQTKSNKEDKIKKGKVVIVMSLLMLMFNLVLNNVSAVDDNEYFGVYNVYSFVDSYRYIRYQDRPQRIHEYYYIDKNSNILPAYCLSLGLKGAETVDGGYSVNASEFLGDEVVNNIILSGYPYKTVEELGVANESEARYATQFAVWIKICNLDINAIEPMEYGYQRVVDAINKIYNDGINFNLNYTNGVKITEIKKEGIIDEVDKSYYSKTYELEYGDNILDINLNITGISSYIITDNNNNKIDNIVGNKKIKILFPRSGNIGDINCKIDVNCSYKEKAMMFATPDISEMQEVSLTLLPVNYKNMSLSFNEKGVITKLIITKKDKTNDNVFIPNVKFSVYDINNQLLGNYVTDDKGKINIDIESDLKIFKDTTLVIKETEVPYPYVIEENTSQQVVDIKVGETKNVEFKNKKAEEKKKVELPKTGC